MKGIKKRMIAVLTAVTLIVATALPAMAAEQKETYTSHFGVSYTVDYTQGAVEVDGTRVYLGYDGSSEAVRLCGWRTIIRIKSAEIADLVTVDPEWWSWMKTKYPSVEDYYHWKAAKR